MTKPSLSERKRVPTSTAALSPVSAALCGTAEAGQMLHGQPEPEAARVVNVQLSSAASALPARSLTPALPPRTVAVYVAPAVSAAVGSSVAVREPAS